MGRVPRVYLPPSAFVAHEVRPHEDCAHYLKNVLRLRSGDRWAALDGTHRAWLCEIIDHQLSRKIEDWPAVPPLSVSIEVGLALCKGSRFEDALEKLAELGVVKVVPLATERTERGLPSPAKADRWKQISLAASALANRKVPMQVDSARSLDAYTPELEVATTVYCHHDGAHANEVFHPPRNTYRLLIGPEGGFAPAELERLQARARRVSLGPLTLRVETAAVCAVSLAIALSRPAPSR